MKNSLMFFFLPIIFTVLGLLWLFPVRTPGNSIQNSNHKKLGPHLLYEETFEGPDPFDFVWKQFPENHSFDVSSDQVFEGKKSGKFELRYGDRVVTKTGVRSEVLFPEQLHRERWYSFAVFFPADGFGTDTDPEIISQWHQEKMGSPSVSLLVKNNRLNLNVGNDVKVGGSKRDNFDLGPVQKNSWNEFVFHYIHSNESDGLIEIWKNGEKILTRQGGNIYPGILPKWKIGIYKWIWETTQTNVDKRILYFDNVRMGNEHASLKDMISTQNKEVVL